MILEKTTLSRARLFLFNLLLWLPWTCGANTTNSITGYPAVTSMAGGDEFLIGQQIGPTNWQLRTIQASNAPSFGSVGSSVIATNFVPNLVYSNSYGCPILISVVASNAYNQEPITLGFQIVEFTNNGTVSIVGAVQVQNMSGTFINTNMWCLSGPVPSGWYYCITNTTPIGYTSSSNYLFPGSGQITILGGGGGGSSTAITSNSIAAAGILGNNTSGFATTAGTATMANGVQSGFTLTIDSAVGIDAGYRKTNSPYASLYCVSTNALPGDCIKINPGSVLFETNYNLAAGGIVLTNNVTLIAYGATVGFSNGSTTAIMASLVLGNNDKLYGGTYSNYWWTGEIYTAAVIGNSAFQNTNNYCQDLFVYSPGSGFQFRGNLVSACTFFNCYANVGYTAWGQASSSGGGANIVCRNCVAISTNQTLAVIGDQRTGFKMAGGNSGTMLLDNCMVVVADNSSVYAAEGFGTKTATPIIAGQIIAKNVIIDTTQCTNPASTDVFIASATNAALFFNVTRADGNMLTWANPTAATVQPFVYMQSGFAGNGSGLTGLNLNIISNAWNLATATNGMPNFSSLITSSNGVPVIIYNSNNVPFIYNLSSPGGGIIP